MTNLTPAEQEEIKQWIADAIREAIGHLQQPQPADNPTVTLPEVSPANEQQ
jgi:hypothetical protein